MTAKSKKTKFLKIEKRLVKLCVLVLLLFPVLNVFSKATLSKVNLEVERLKNKVEAQEKTNESLTMKVNELKSLENIQNIVQSQGLAYNSNNIKVVAED